MRNTNQYDMRGFHILSDAMGGFQPIDAVCQFEYKNHQISIPTMGLGRVACQSEIMVSGGVTREQELYRCRTVQEAIEFIDKL